MKLRNVYFIAVSHFTALKIFYVLDRELAPIPKLQDDDSEELKVEG